MQPCALTREYHWRDALRWGVLPWYLAYIVLALIHRTGGRRHPLEAPAYAAADRVRAAMLEELEK